MGRAILVKAPCIELQLKALVNEELVPQQGRDHENDHVRNEHETRTHGWWLSRLRVRRRATTRSMLR
jgi:hypothetical protein